MPANSIVRRSFSDAASRKPFARPGIPWIDICGRILCRAVRWEAGPIRYPSASGSSLFRPGRPVRSTAGAGTCGGKGCRQAPSCPHRRRPGSEHPDRDVAGPQPGDGPDRGRGGAAANRWVNALFTSAHLVTDLRKGTPDDRAPLPRPARRYRVVRGGRPGAYLSSKEGKPGQVRALHRGRLHELGAAR